MGIFTSNRPYVYEKNRFLYHFLLMISFVGAVLLLSWLTKVIAGKIQNEVVYTILAYFVDYLLAIYVFPEILFLFVKWNSKAETQSR